MISTKVSIEIKSKFTDCKTFIDVIIDDITQEQISILCKNVDFNQPKTLLPIINTCLYLYSEDWETLKNLTDLSYVQMNQLCDPDELSFQFFIDSAELDL